MNFQKQDADPRLWKFVFLERETKKYTDVPERLCYNNSIRNKRKAIIWRAIE